VIIIPHTLPSHLINVEIITVPSQAGYDRANELFLEFDHPLLLANCVEVVFSFNFKLGLEVTVVVLG
jgi:hypothetical protein